jgi:hypothetical protein
MASCSSPSTMAAIYWNMSSVLGSLKHNSCNQWKILEIGSAFVFGLKVCQLSFAQ